ncbi:TlpA family protein disulfide reductase [uncultured Sphingomonas sp.]|uniref:TlpA family protein disulfide reductase n=1 Tax=uncultured Sphingomonas sp. TaxID=158754 RepID=UPI0035CB6743
MSSRPGVVLLLGSALFAAACDRQATAPEQATASAPASDEVVAGSAPPAGAAKAAATGFDRSHVGEAAPTAAFVAPDGKQVTFADFRGKPLLVNLWATWCAPCIAELPTLDDAAGRLGDRVRVLTIAQDLDEKPDKVTKFLAARGFKRLAPYRDPAVALSTAYAANLPATILYDARGREVWRRLGGFEWNTPEAMRAIAEASQVAG